MTNEIDRALVIRALVGVLTNDGCVLGCPKKRSSDSAHNLRCTQVWSAIRNLRSAMLPKGKIK